jgi:hypothetical protein
LRFHRLVFRDEQTLRTDRIFNRKKRLAVSLCDKFQFHTFATISLLW